MLSWDKNTKSNKRDFFSVLNWVVLDDALLYIFSRLGRCSLNGDSSAVRTYISKVLPYVQGVLLLRYTQQLVIVKKHLAEMTARFLVEQKAAN